MCVIFSKDSVSGVLLKDGQARVGKTSHLIFGIVNSTFYYPLEALDIFSRQFQLLKMQLPTTVYTALAIISVVYAHPSRGKAYKDYSSGYPFDDTFKFTSTYKVWATPDQVVNTNNTFTGGLPGAKGLYKYGINSDENVICFNITLKGFRGEYQSPAVTATHIHEAPQGKSGPPR